jgi:hypothetical protein
MSTKGLFLIWDGNVGYGLTDKCRTSDANQFEVVIEKNEEIKLKNRRIDLQLIISILVLANIF